MPARILIIEDNATNLELMAYLLGGFGHTVLSAGDGLEGLEKARQQKPDVIICDVQLPKMDGYEVVRSLRKDPECCQIPTVAVTALAMVGDRERALQAGFDGYLAKPIDPKTFVTQIEAFLSPSAAGSMPRPASVTPQSSRGACAGKRILAVDNVQANLDLVRGIFEPFGYNVDTASTAAEALRKARLGPPDLILSDVCMAEMSGYDFIRHVKATPNLEGIPFVFLTSTMLNEGDRSRGIALGAVRFLTRPIDPQDLFAQVESCLGMG